MLCFHEVEVLCVMMQCLVECMCVAEIALQAAAGEQYPPQIIWSGKERSRA